MFYASGTFYLIHYFFFWRMEAFRWKMPVTHKTTVICDVTSCSLVYKCNVLKAHALYFVPEIEVAGSSETLVAICQITHCNVQRNLKKPRTHCCNFLLSSLPYRCKLTWLSNLPLVAIKVAICISERKGIASGKDVSERYFFVWNLNFSQLRLWR